MWKILLVAAWTIGIPGAVSAQSGITYDCDTAPGRYSELSLPAPATPFTVSGNVKVKVIAKDKTWGPVARVRISSTPTSPGASPAAYAGFKLTTFMGKDLGIAAETVQALSFDTLAGETDVIPSSLRPTGDALPFRLTYDGRSVAVTVGDQSRSFPVAADPALVQVFCSTGEFLITDLKLEPTT